MPRGYRDRAEDSLLSLIGDLPELITSLVKAEINAAKAWVSRVAPGPTGPTCWTARATPPAWVR